MEETMKNIEAITDAITLLQNHGVDKIGMNLEANPFPHSFEFGPAGARHKIYYSDLNDLKSKIDAALQGEQHANEVRGKNSTGGASQ